MGDNTNNNQETNNQNNNGTGTGTVTEQAQFDYDKFEEIMTKVMSKREDSVAKSILKDNGIDGDDLKDFLATYKAQKEAKANSATQELENLRKENEAYKAREKENAINSVVNSTAKTLGIDTDKLAMMKFDTSTAVDKDGKVNADKMKTALEALVEKAPWLKSETDNNNANNQNNNGNNGGFKPGNPGGDGKKDDKTEINRIRKLAGLKPIE